MFYEMSERMLCERMLYKRMLCERMLYERTLCERECCGIEDVE
jgi:hypothetical protein